MSNVLILGGTGFVGRSVCEKLVERSGGADGRITVPSRRPQRAQHLRTLPTVELIQSDVHDAAALTRLLVDCDVVINLIAILHGGEADFQRVHVELPRKLVAACQSSGVKRVVHVSALGAAADAPSKYLRSKAAGEAVLRAAGLDLTVLRPSVIFGEHDRFLNLFASLQAVAPVMPLAGAAARFQPVWVEDVAAAIVASIDDRSSIGQTVECGGPTVYTLEQLVRFAGRCAGHERPVIALPDAIARLQAVVMGWLPGEPLMSGDNLDSMRVPNVLSGDSPGLEALGIEPASMEAVMTPLLAGRAGVARLEPLRASAHRR
ncbi:MAG: complex I NDUFA9 subunit family protein [Burkholderiaceae bacterium]|nr:complex I NDUFA9 subunit family protein [Burkholderiaceae bacterium]